MNKQPILRLLFILSSLWLSACGDCIDNANCNNTSEDDDTPVTNEFITVWKTDNQGVTSANQIKIDTLGDGYNYRVEWGDGETNSEVTGDIVHTYETPGTYTVTISGQFPQLYFEPITSVEDELGRLEEVFNSDNGKIVSVEQWGNLRWRSMEAAFRGAKNLVINASDKPDLSNVTSLKAMFSGASSFNQSIDFWDVSNVTDFSEIFASASSFNQSLASWDVSSAVDMSRMFFNASSFNQGLATWDVSNVTNMHGMFWGAIAFNQGIGSWDVSLVTDMSMMFANTQAFNQSIGQWDIGNVTNMESMFTGAIVFNQPISAWDVSAVTNMRRLFWRASAFNQPIDSWDVSSVTDMREAFKSATVFNQPLATWNIINVTDLSGMFTDAAAFSQNIDDWDVRNVDNMEEMLDRSGLTTQQYDALLNSWSRLPLQSGVLLGAGTLQYSAQAQAAHNLLRNNFQWVISDGGLAQ